MTLTRARDLADLVLKCLSIAAICVGGVWAYYQFRIARVDTENIQLSLVAESIPYSAESCLLLVHAKPKNIGKIVVAPSPSFTVTVRRLPSDAKLGFLNIESAPVVYATDLLKRFPEGYELEPGVEYDELIPIVASKGYYAIKGVVDLGESDNVDDTIVVRVECGS